MNLRVCAEDSTEAQPDISISPVIWFLYYDPDKIKKKNRVYLQAGAGIVADSVPENEYQECCNKVMALAKTLIEEENL